MSINFWSLLVSISGLIIIIWLFLHYSKKKNDENSNNGKDTLYICGYAVLIILELIVYVCMSNYHRDDIIATISFGATLSSLIMSVVAIIYTIVAGKDGREQLGRITQATEELKRTSSELTEFKAISIAISDSLTEFEQKLGYIYSGIHTLEDKVENGFSRLSGSTEGSQLAHNKDNIEIFINNGSMTGAMALLACCLSESTGKKLELSNIVGEDSMEYCYGYIIAASAAGYIQFENDWPNISVTAVPKELQPTIEKLFELKIGNGREPNQEMQLKAYNHVRAFYGISSYSPT